MRVTTERKDGAVFLIENDVDDDKFVGATHRPVRDDKMFFIQICKSNHKGKMFKKLCDLDKSHFRHRILETLPNCTATELYAAKKKWMEELKPTLNCQKPSTIGFISTNELSQQDYWREFYRNMSPERKEKMLQRKKKYNDEHKDRRTKYSELSDEKKEAISEWKKEYYKAKKEQMNEYMKSYYKQNREKILERERKKYLEKKKKRCRLETESFEE